MRKVKTEREADRYKRGDETFTEKLANFWYYNKVKIFISIAGILLFCSMLMITLTKEKEDLHVFYVTENSVVYTEQIDRLEDVYKRQV